MTNLSEHSLTQNERSSRSQNGDKERRPNRSVTGERESWLGTDLKAEKRPQILPRGGIEGLIFKSLTDEDLVYLCRLGYIRTHDLENELGDPVRAIRIRRRTVTFGSVYTKKGQRVEELIPLPDHERMAVLKMGLPSLIGYIPMSVSAVGPLIVDKESFFVPLCTPDAEMLRKLHRGSTIVNDLNGIATAVLTNCIVGGPRVMFPSLQRSLLAKHWLESSSGLSVMRALSAQHKEIEVLSCTATLLGQYLDISFRMRDGDTIGTSNVASSYECALQLLRQHGFSDMTVIDMSGGLKSCGNASCFGLSKPQGYHVVAQSIVQKDTRQMRSPPVLDTQVSTPSYTTPSGFESPTEVKVYPIVLAVFLATGQDTSLLNESSRAIVTWNRTDDNKMLITISMPSIFVGTTSGHENSNPQAGSLDLLGLNGPSAEGPGRNAQKLARIIVASALAFVVGSTGETLN